MPCRGCAGTSLCLNSTTAKTQPASAECDTLCSETTGEAACEVLNEQDQPCKWCSSRAVPSKCYNATNAARLPPGVFVCAE
jgi:hypothetical protein